MVNEVNLSFEVILYNKTRPNDKIVKKVFSNNVTSVYILQSGKDLQMFAEVRQYQFSKNKVMPHNFKHVSTITECFEIEIPSDDYKDVLYCIVSEPLNRDFVDDETKQNGINLFRDVWMKYLQCSVTDAFRLIDEAYLSKDSIGEEFVLRSIESSNESVEEKKVAIALNGAFKDVMTLGPAIIWPDPMNIGVADDGIVKITYIGIRG